MISICKSIPCEVCCSCPFPALDVCFDSSCTLLSELLSVVLSPTDAQGYPAEWGGNRISVADAASHQKKVWSVPSLACSGLPWELSVKVFGGQSLLLFSCLGPQSMVKITRKVSNHLQPLAASTKSSASSSTKNKSDFSNHSRN